MVTTDRVMLSNITSSYHFSLKQLNHDQWQITPVQQHGGSDRLKQAYSSTIFLLNPIIICSHHYVAI